MKLPFRWPLGRGAPEAEPSPAPDVRPSDVRPTEIGAQGAATDATPQPWHPRLANQCWAYAIDSSIAPVGAFPPDAGPIQALSYLPPELAQVGGLPGEAIYGFFASDRLSAEHFVTDRVFVDFLHKTMASTGPLSPSLQAAAARQAEGYVYVIDARTPDGPQGNVPPEDIVGGFKVSQGLIVEGGYWANANYRIYTAHGPPRLPAELCAELIAAWVKRP